MNAWWLAVVPAVAAAFVWPVGRGVGHAPAAQAATPETAVSSAWRRITEPPVLDTVTAAPRAPRTSQAPAAARARQAATATLAHRGADASGVADEPRPDTAPTAPRVEMPQIYIVDAPAPAPPAAKPLVRTEEFNTRIKIPGAPE